MTQPKCAPLACCHDVALPWPCPGPLPGTTEPDSRTRQTMDPTIDNNHQPTNNHHCSTKPRSLYPIAPDPNDVKIIYCWDCFDFRVLTISSDVSTVLTVLNEVVPNLEENGARQGDDIDLRMLVHQSQAGCVIGKGGLNIKELRDVSHFENE
ncbi:hypothetical protein M0802_000499 [Mischocyttarus mexicanus]|nr:hypothetical protein M0802_000499 [Mischocyttarus mexicanus]